MARVTLPMGIRQISGKVGNMCFRTMKETGKVFVSSLPRARMTPLSVKEIESRERFKKRVRLVSMMRKAGSRLSDKELWQLAKQAV